MRKTILSLVCVFALLSACDKIVLNEPSPNPVNTLKSTDTNLSNPLIDSTTVVIPTPTVIPPVVKSPVVIPRVVVPSIVIKTPFVIPRVVIPPFGVPPVVIPPPVVLPPVVVPPVVVPPVVVPPVVVPPVVVPPVVVPPVVGVSFSKDGVPVLAMCQNCHIHGWTSSTNASTYYTNLVNSSYVNVASYTSSKIYSGINNGHFSTNSLSKANTDKIINWMKEGSKNN